MNRNYGFEAMHNAYAEWSDERTPSRPQGEDNDPSRNSISSSATCRRHVLRWLQRDGSAVHEFAIEHEEVEYVLARIDIC